MLPSTYIRGGVPPHVLLLCGVGVWSCAPVRNGPLLPRQGHDALGRGRRQMCLCPAAGARGRGAGGGIPVTHRSTGSPGDKVPLQSRFLGGGGTGLLDGTRREGGDGGRNGWRRR